MAKVLFVNPLVREEDAPRHVPYGIALLAAISMDKGHQVQVFDDNAWRLGEDVAKQVYTADKWDVVALGGITTAYRSIKKHVKLARKLCPDATIVLGGGVLTSLPREMMEWLPQVDVGVIGEAFETFPEILEYLDTGKQQWQDIKGTVSRAADGELLFGEKRELIKDLDVLPYPAWDLFPLEEVYFKNSEMLYSEEGMLARRRLDVNVSYGCSLVCRYCYHLGIAGDMRYENDKFGKIQVHFDEPKNYSREIRYHSPDYVVKMVKHMIDKYNIDFIGFLDENLMTMNRYSKGTWLSEICEQFIKQDIAPQPSFDEKGNLQSWTGIYWGGTSHATLCDEQILKLMRQAGCAYLVYGYESFAPHVLKTIGKGASLKHNIRSFYWTMDADIRPVPNVIIGFPDEDVLSIRQNIQAMNQLGIESRPHFATAYPGSEWFTVYRDKIVAQYNGNLEAFIEDLGDASRITAVISRNFNAVELMGLRELIQLRDERLLDLFEQQKKQSDSAQQQGGAHYSKVS